MKSIYLSFLLLAFAYAAAAQTNYVQISTAKGDIIVMLYDETPLHRDNFLKVIRTGTFRDPEFNRVIRGFVSQGGELDETILDREKLHPALAAERIAAEIRPSLFHKKGALGAGRNDNPEKSSYLDQIYLVEGKKYTDAQLDDMETKTGHHFSAGQRAAYKTIGGTPHLDGDYTVFGEIVSGVQVAEATNAVATDKKDRPLSPLSFKLKILTKKEIKELTFKKK
jgi:cyclophilin family peptidyl-prolyl cis-trans isomerase